jgi:hypothetical protein
MLREFTLTLPRGENYAGDFSFHPTAHLAEPLAIYLALRLAASRPALVSMASVSAALRFVGYEHIADDNGECMAIAAALNSEARPAVSGDLVQAVTDHKEACLNLESASERFSMGNATSEELAEARQRVATTATAKDHIHAHLTGASRPTVSAETPRIVCLCGSTRFMEAFFDVGWDETLKGHIVLSVGVCKHATDHGAEALGQDVADRLDELHLRKIDLADEVVILNVGGYIGPSTRRELEYAKKLGKPVRYLEHVAAIVNGEGA